ncbi:MAG: DUF1972 domain-containing protein [Gammaproteobacteria bacterium]|nr:DUF1972 domain-containing protein [Gammaproteobacteria bacterium]
MSGGRFLRIAGIRGIPATHGGFETFCERLALGLTRRGWQICVYCQARGEGEDRVDIWRGIQRVHVPVNVAGPLGTIVFDWKCIRHALKAGKAPLLILGYNTAIFSLLLRMKGIPVIFNMDGVEWARAKWAWHAKVWLFVNDLAASFIGNALIADHPLIADMLNRRALQGKVVTIPYGAPRVESPDPELLREFDLERDGYCLLIGRAEPENSILEIVSAYSSRSRPVPLVVVGNYNPAASDYHRRVRRAAGHQVRFVGAIFEKSIVETLRSGARLYVHGHQVGGTNPSLVEAIAAGNAVLAHDNRFNRWCAGEEAAYFDSEESCARMFDELLEDSDRLERMRAASRRRHLESFDDRQELDAYEACLARWVEDR